ncbi:MAG: TspO/MBR family protein [Eggerthellaceae bacterium]|nr:TspO/MBR family protein [Eggerthellaceae bacterium]
MREGTVRSMRGMKVRRSARSYLAAMWVAFAAMVVCNVLFELLRLGGTTSAEVSGAVFAWFTPAGYVFAIWGVIYLALLAWLVYCTLGEMRRAWHPAWDLTAVAVLFAASCALNVAWLVLFHLQLVAASMAVIVALWATVAVLYRAVRKGTFEMPPTALGWMPVSLYAAWLTVAVAANASNLVTRVMGEGAPVAGAVSTLVLAAIVLLAGYFMRTRRADSVAPLVFLWAVVGVGVHTLDASVPVAIGLFALATLAALVTFVPIAITRAPAHAK